MQAVRSINYFRDTLTTALNYFGRKQKKIEKCQDNVNNEEDFIEIIKEEEDEIPIIEPNNALHNSYRLFYKSLPITIIRDVNIRQNRVRDFYKKTLDIKITEPLIKLTQQMSNVNEIEEAFQHDLEHNFETMDANDDDDEQIILFDELSIENEIDQKQTAV
jgi:hypothetical protein